MGQGGRKIRRALFAERWQEARVAREKLGGIVGRAYELAMQGNAPLLKFLIQRYERPIPRGAGSVNEDHAISRIEIVRPGEIKPGDSIP